MAIKLIPPIPGDFAGFYIFPESFFPGGCSSSDMRGDIGLSSGEFVGF